LEDGSPSGRSSGGRAARKSQKAATKWSMSTEAKTSAGSGKMLNGMFFND